jgi:hypothetical protein
VVVKERLSAIFALPDPLARPAAARVVGFSGRHYFVWPSKMSDRRAIHMPTIMPTDFQNMF